MTSWSLAAVCNGVIAGAYLLISLAVVVPLARSRQLRDNPLGAATGAIFFTCAVHRFWLATTMGMASWGAGDPQGLALRQAWDWPLTMIDLICAAVAVYYCSLRRAYSSAVHGAHLFEDVREREQTALELNDTVLQGLVVAKMALEVRDTHRAAEALDSSIEAVRDFITHLLGNQDSSLALVRGSAASLSDAPDPSGIRPSPIPPPVFPARAPTHRATISPSMSEGSAR